VVLLDEAEEPLQVGEAVPVGGRAADRNRRVGVLYRLGGGLVEQVVLLGVPLQNTMFGSFHTSNGQVLTSARP
jgi:hypothetical protein